MLFNRDIETSKCGSKMDNIPFPEYCLPKYEVENRNLCQQDDISQINQFTTLTGAAAMTEEQLDPSKLINNKAMRGLYHQVMTKHNFFGKYSGKKGDFEIPAEQNGKCEFKFITPVDNKEYTMYLTDDAGKNITLDNFTKQSITISGNRAKGTFVDRNLREIENRLNLPRLPFHGFADIKFLNNTDILAITNKNTIPNAYKFKHQVAEPKQLVLIPPIYYWVYINTLLMLLQIININLRVKQVLNSLLIQMKGIR